MMIVGRTYTLCELMPVCFSYIKNNPGPAHAAAIRQKYIRGLVLG